jgi:hypothetical protein
MSVKCRDIDNPVVFLSLCGTLMTLPFVGMFCGSHEWTAAHWGFGARIIALIDSMADSPLGQAAMSPMLAWIAKEAPRRQMVTYLKDAWFWPTGSRPDSLERALLRVKSP